MADEHYLKAELYRRIADDPEIFDFLQEGSLDGLWYWDLENPEHEWLSPRFKAVFGYEEDEIPHTSEWWQENIFPEDLPSVLERAQAHLENADVPYDQIVRYRHKDGSTVWIRCRGLALRDESGKPVRMLGCHTDVSSLKKTQLEIERQLEQLAALHASVVSKNEALSRFAFIASHDLREPLRTVCSYSELLAEHLGDDIDDEARLFLGFILDGTRRMQDLVRDLHAYAQLESEEFETRSVSTEALFERLSSNLQARPDALVFPTTNLCVEVHEGMVSQLLLNLVQNAVKYGPIEGPSRVEFSISLLDKTSSGAERPFVRFEVEDNGIGIEPQFHETIFEIFQRLHNKQEYPGTGIGLALCKRICELHGGEIGVASAAGEGARFWFTLPAADEAC